MFLGLDPDDEQTFSVVVYELDGQCERISAAVLRCIWNPWYRSLHTRRRRIRTIEKMRFWQGSKKWDCISLGRVNTRCLFGWNVTRNRDWKIVWPRGIPDTKFFAIFRYDVIRSIRWKTIKNFPPFVGWFYAREAQCTFIFNLLVKCSNETFEPIR